MAIVRSPIRRIPAALVAVALTLTASCGGGGGGTEPVRVPTQLVVTPATLALVVGESRTVTAEPRDASGIVPGQAVTWTTSDPAVATVTGGTILAKAVGSATITASAGAYQGSVALTVTPIPVATVSVIPAQKTLLVTETTQLSATPMSGANVALTDRAVAWTSSDETVATVSASGLVTTKRVGTATITATSEGKSGTSALTVNPVPVSRVLIQPASFAVFMGEQDFMEALVLDSANGPLSGRTVTWTTSDPSIATVFALNATRAAVTGVKAGVATITATAEGKSGTRDVTVLFGPRLRLGVSGMPAPFDKAPVRLESVDAAFYAELDIPGGPPVDFNRLAPGAYTLTAKPITISVNGTSFTYLPVESDVVHTFPVTTTATATVNLAWILRTGALAVTTTGLPAGANVACNYQFDPPGIGGTATGGFTVPTAQTTTVAVYGSGPATLSCQPVTIGAVNYAPTVATQSLNVPASTIPLAVTVTYAPE